MDEPQPARKRNVVRDILLSLVAGGVFAAVLISYLLRETRAPEGPKLVATSPPAPHGPDTLEVAQRVASAFVTAIGAGNLEGAYAQMARPYREAASVAAFRAAWQGAPLLAGPRSVKLTSTRVESMQVPDGGLLAAATFTARGLLLVSAGPLETSFTFLREGGEAHVLAVFVGGVPIVQGLGPATPH